MPKLQRYSKRLPGFIGREKKQLTQAEYMVYLIQAHYTGLRAIRKLRLPLWRANHLPAILAIGGMKEPRLTDISNRLGIANLWILSQLKRLITYGYIIKQDNKRYRLTEVGEMAYKTFTKHYNPNHKGFIDYVVMEAKKEFISSKLDSIAA